MKRIDTALVHDDDGKPAAARRKNIVLLSAAALGRSNRTIIAVLLIRLPE